MNRRTVLAGASTGLVGGLVGCLGDINHLSSGKPETDMRLSLAAVDEGPDPLAFEIDVIDQQLTTTAVPMLDITVRNTGSETATWLNAATGAVPRTELVFPCQYAMPDKLTIGLEAEVSDLLVNDEGCARTEDDINRSQAPTETTLSPDDTLEGRYAVAGNDQKLDGSCPPPGTYRTECTYEGHGIWGFEVELTHPKSYR